MDNTIYRDRKVMSKLQSTL